MVPMKDLTLKAARHWVVNLTLRIGAYEHGRYDKDRSKGLCVTSNVKVSAALQSAGRPTGRTSTTDYIDPYKLLLIWVKNNSLPFKPKLSAFPVTCISCLHERKRALRQPCRYSHTWHRWSFYRHARTCIDGRRSRCPPHASGAGS